MDPIVSGAAANLASEATKGIFQEVKRHVRYVINYQKNVEKFEKKMKFLIAKRESVQQEVDAAERNVETEKVDVKFWCQQVDKTIDEEVKKMKDLQDQAKAKCFIGLCPNIKSRYQLSRKAVADVAVVDELLQQGQFNKVTVRYVPEAPMINAAPKNFKDFDSRKEVFDEIMEALNDSTISMIGVYGTGGVGKTTLVNEVVRQIAADTLSGSVVKATVTVIPNIEKIQDQIAESLCLKLEEKCLLVRASRVMERLKKEKKIIVVLDDVWKRLDLEQVGIPFGDQHKGCKLLVIISRDRNVLTNEMDANKTIAVGVLNEKEGWDLFKKMAGSAGYDFENPELQSIASEVAKRCGGLPLTIVTVARALKNKDLYAWKDACLQLQRPSPTGIPGPVYAAIELSYDSLESKELKQTFMLSCLFGNNAYIEDLLRWAMGLHLFDGLDTVEKNRNRILTLVSNLKDSCLLLDGYKDDRIAMHDFVCDVALAIASRENHAFALKNGDGNINVFEDWEDHEERMKEFKWISLSFSSINNKLPHKLELCPQLSLFSMSNSTNDSYVEMPNSFFENMEKIQVLYLMQMDFWSSPLSISLPTSLRTLCLECCVMGDMANLGKLKNLEILSLFGSNIEMLPQEIRQLKKLRLLDLSCCAHLSIIPPGVFSSLSRLEELHMSGITVPWNHDSNACLDELKELSCLTTLFISILDAKIVPRDWFSEKLQRYQILIGGEWDWDDEVEYSPRTLKLRVNRSIDHLDDGFKRLLKKAEALSLENLEGVEIVLKQVGNRNCFLHLNHLHIRNASEIQYVMQDDDDDEIVFRGLRSLRLENLPHLISFCSSRNRTEGFTSSLPQHDQSPLFGEQMELPCLEDLCLFSMNIGSIWHKQFSALENLTGLIIQGCGNLKYIFSSSMATRLVHLKSFEIVECKSLREIIFCENIEEEEEEEEEEENEVTILFPRLRSLIMKNLPRLIGYCSENYNLVFPSLNRLKIKHCPKFKRFIYKSTTDQENQRLHSMQPLFDEKVVCPNLNYLVLSSVDVERIWHHEMSYYVKNLSWLKVEGCHNLRCLFSSSMMPLLMQLQFIKIIDCANIEVVFIEEEEEIEADQEDIIASRIFPKLSALLIKDLPRLKSFCHGFESCLEFPLLRFLGIFRCPAFKTFISQSKDAKGNSSNIDFPPFFNEKVAFPLLEDLSMGHLGNLRKIWHHQLLGDSFSNLNKLSVRNCNKLVNVFPFTMSQRLKNMENISLRDCDSLQDIFEPQVLNDAVTTTQSINEEETTPNFVFPKLTGLEFCWLERLRSFYHSIHTIECPSLQKIRLNRCEMVKIFASESLSFGELTNQQPLFWVTEVTFPNLEELKLDSNSKLRKIWHGQLRPEFFKKLRVIELIWFFNTPAVFPHDFIQSLPNLEKLVVGVTFFRQLFNFEGFGDGNEIDGALALASLNELRLAALSKLKHLLKEDYVFGDYRLSWISRFNILFYC